jgi:hypothetical protein
MNTDNVRVKKEKLNSNIHVIHVKRKTESEVEKQMRRDQEKGITLLYSYNTYIKPKLHAFYTLIILMLYLYIHKCIYLYIFIYIYM